MPARLSYVLMAKYGGVKEATPDAIQELSRRLHDRGVSSCYIGRNPGSDLDGFIRISDLILRKGILPVIELHPGDPAPLFRNLAETCCLGTLPVSWSSGNPAFGLEALLEVINAAGRNRLPLDLLLDPGSPPPGVESISPVLEPLGALARKYSHIQIVKLVSMPGVGENPALEKDALSLFEAVLKACPKSKAAVEPDIWMASEPARLIAEDLGGVTVTADDLAQETSYPGVIGRVHTFAGSIGMEPMSRLPLLPLQYRKGWFTFEVGKVFDAWVDRNAFRFYRDRPGWLVE